MKEIDIPEIIGRTEFERRDIKQLTELCRISNFPEIKNKYT